MGTQPLFDGEVSWCRLRTKSGGRCCNILKDLSGIVIWEEGEAALAPLSCARSEAEPLPPAASEGGRLLLSLFPAIAACHNTMLGPDPAVTSPWVGNARSQAFPRCSCSLWGLQLLE